jgi:predicted dehydrogenase
MTRLRMGLVGGGPGAFIGPIHRIAAELDGEIELVAGAFSSDPERSRQAGLYYGVSPERAYASYAEMFAAERERADGIDFVTIATPNHTHLPIARAALEAGIAVMSDKPATATLSEARTLAGAVDAAQVPYALSYSYSGYPMVRQARVMIAAGAIGPVRKVVAEYLQGWLAEPIEAGGNKQADWRTQPEKSGLGGAISDIGVHAFHLAEFVTGLEVQTLCADLTAMVDGRTLDDDASVLLHFNNGARGVLLASQVAVGEANGLSLRIYGTRGALIWRQENPNRLEHRQLDGRIEVLTAGLEGLSSLAMHATRLPAGHPEGYLEAFANLYRDFARRLRGEAVQTLPGIGDGLRSMLFVERAVVASRGRLGWVSLNEEEECVA